MRVTISTEGTEYRPVDVELTIGYPEHAIVLDDAIRGEVGEALERALAALNR